VEVPEEVVVAATFGPVHICLHNVEGVDGFGEEGFNQLLFYGGVGECGLGCGLIGKIGRLIKGGFGNII
jgi:hypothetical protein